MIGAVVAIVVGTLFSACCLWAGMKLTNVDGKFLAMLIIAAVSSLLGLIPTVGWLIGTIAMYVLICKWTDAEFWPDAVLMVVVAKAVGIFGGMFLAGLFASVP